MNENIDLTKILDGCPEGTKLYSTLLGIVEFVRIGKGVIEVIENLSKRIHFFDYKGKYYSAHEDAECILFPSCDQRDWSKFERFWDKPKVERFDPKTLQPFDRVLVKFESSEPDNVWYCDLVNWYDAKLKRVIITHYGVENQVIPFNDETKHLLGTTNDCPEYYKWWEE